MLLLDENENELSWHLGLTLSPPAFGSGANNCIALDVTFPAVASAAGGTAGSCAPLDSLFILRYLVSSYILNPTPPFER